jgi:hypothetical protein
MSIRATAPKANAVEGKAHRKHTIRVVEGTGRGKQLTAYWKGRIILNELASTAARAGTGCVCVCACVRACIGGGGADILVILVRHSRLPIASGRVPTRVTILLGMSNESVA